MTVSVHHSGILVIDQVGENISQLDCCFQPHHNSLNDKGVSPLVQKAREAESNHAARIGLLGNIINVNGPCFLAVDNSQITHLENVLEISSVRLSVAMKMSTGRLEP